MNGPFSSKDIHIELNISKDAANPNFVEVSQTTAIGKTNEANIAEWQKYGSAFTQRIITGGKSNQFSFETKLVPGDPAHEELRKIIFSNDVNIHNFREIRLTFPTPKGVGAIPRTELYTGVINPTADGGQGSTDVAVLNFDFMTSGTPVVNEGLDIIDETVVEADLNVVFTGDNGSIDYTFTTSVGNGNVDVSAEPDGGTLEPGDDVVFTLVPKNGFSVNGKTVDTFTIAATTDS